MSSKAAFTSGMTVAEMKAMGASAAQLLESSYDLATLRANGYVASDFKHLTDISIAEMKQVLHNNRNICIISSPIIIYQLSFI